MGPSSYILLIEAMERMQIPGYDYAKLKQCLIKIVNQTMQKEEAQSYPKEEVISLHLAKARKGIERVQFLKEFGYVSIMNSH